MCFLHFLVVVLYLFGFCGGLNYSKMSNLGSRTYDNIFWIIFGNSKMFTKSGSLQTPYVSQKSCKRYKRRPRIFETYFLHISSFWKSEIAKIVDTTRHQTCGTHIGFTFQFQMVDSWRCWIEKTTLRKPTV